MNIRPTLDKFVGLLLVVALHAAALWGLWSHRLISMPQDVETLFVNFIAPPPRVESAPKREPPSGGISAWKRPSRTLAFVGAVAVVVVLSAFMVVGARWFP